jgi:hypothetical protein
VGSASRLAILIGLAGGGAFIGVDKLLKGFRCADFQRPRSASSSGSPSAFFIGNSVLFKFIDEEPKLIAQIVMYVVGTYLGW